MKIFYSREKKIQQKWSLLFLVITIAEQNFLLVNLYNANMEKDQLNTIGELTEMLKRPFNRCPRWESYIIKNLLLK